MNATPVHVCDDCSQPFSGKSGRCSACREIYRMRAFLTYRALSPDEQKAIDFCARERAERYCDEVGAPRHDYNRTLVARGARLYDVVKAWSEAVGRYLALPPSITFARSVDTFFVEALHERHREVMDRVAPRRKFEQ